MVCHGEEPLAEVVEAIEVLETHPEGFEKYYGKKRKV
jgi:hypothetical protein